MRAAWVWYAQAETSYMPIISFFLLGEAAATRSSRSCFTVHLYKEGGDVAGRGRRLHYKMALASGRAWW